MRKRSISPDELLVVIRAHCLQCSGGSRKEVSECAVVGCNLYPFRCVEALAERQEKARPEEQVDLFEMIGAKE